MDEIIKKADVLIEALPYIRAFHNKVFVIKYGGKVMLSKSAQKGLWEDLAFLHFVGVKPVLVHGGGSSITQKAASAGKVAKFVEGIRITDTAMIKIVQETLSEINRRITSALRKLDVPAKGLSGAEQRIISVRKKNSKIDLGFVGEIVELKPEPIKLALRKRVVPIVTPLGKGRDKLTYNVNADEAAAEIAAVLKADKFILLTDVKGILRLPDDENSLISTLSESDAEDLIKRRVIQEGMLPKVRACVNALLKGVKKTHIIDGRLPHGILLEIFTDKGIGTEIVK